MDKELKNRWASIVIIALIAVVIVTYFLNRVQLNSKEGELPSSDTAIINAASRTALESAKDNALVTPDFTNYINLGLAYYKAGQNQNSITITLKALKLAQTAKDQSLAYNNLCAFYNALQMPDSAIKAGEQALRLQPDFQLAKNNLESARSTKKK